MLLETYSALDKDHLWSCIPKFLDIEKEVTGNPSYSMFNLSLREDWKNSKRFCQSIIMGEWHQLIKINLLSIISKRIK